MGAAPGIAGSRSPEEEGVFLAIDDWDVKWFAEMGLEAGHESVDVWVVNLPDGLEPSDEADYPLLSRPIPPEAVSLHKENWTARDPASVVGDLFHCLYYGDGDISPSILSDRVVLVDAAGRRVEGKSAVIQWAKKRAHGGPPTPRPRADGSRVIAITNETGYTIEGLDDDRVLVSPQTRADCWSVVHVGDNEVTEIQEFPTRSAAIGEPSP
jgi:hypothetical protein